MNEPVSTPELFLTRIQPLVAAGLGLCLLAATGWLAATGGCSGGLVDHDAPPHIDARFTVNINTASAEELAQLPGLGATTAARIIDYRRDHGPFVSIDSLLDVPGIGAATLDRLRPHLRHIRVPRADGKAAPAAEAAP